MSYDLAVLDLDGTLIPDKGELDPKFARALHRAQEHGFRLTIATGRMPPATQPYLDALGIGEPVIFYNGALVRDVVGKKDLASYLLPSGLAEQTAQVFRLVPVHPLFYRDDRLFCLEATPPIKEYCEEERLTVEAISDLQHFLRGPLIKVLLIGDPPVLADLRQALRPLVSGRGRLVNSRPYYLEILPRDASKGTALRLLSRHLGVPLERIIAAGDQENDLELIRIAGYGIAMPHSPDAVKAVAKRVAPTRDAGGLLALFRELLPEYFS
jgi:Cof subfamily protein (haloacid dehalogenase superfamily)